MTQFFVDIFNYFVEFFIIILVGAIIIEGLYTLFYYFKEL